MFNPQVWLVAKTFPYFFDKTLERSAAVSKIFPKVCIIEGINF